MKTKIRTPCDGLKRRLGGGLFRYTFAFSLAAHVGLWGWLAARDRDAGVLAGPADIGKWVVEGRHKVIPLDKLPQAPSIEPAAPAAKAPEGLRGRGDTGLIPLPVPDDQADVATIPDAPVDNGNFISPDVPIVVVDPGNSNAPGNDPGAVPNFDVEYSEPPVLVKEVKPAYPEIARDSGLEGDVVLLVYVDAAGRVRNAVVRSSPGLPALEDEAKKAALKCEFEPARQQGQPVGVRYSLVMQFKM